MGDDLRGPGKDCVKREFVVLGGCDRCRIGWASAAGGDARAFLATRLPSWLPMWEWSAPFFRQHAGRLDSAGREREQRRDDREAQ